MSSVVSVLFTHPERVADDYKRLMELASWRDHLSGERELLLKLNLSWTKYFPACSSQPWQVDGVLKTLLEGPYTPDRVLPIENKTVVTDPVKGARHNLWFPVFEKYGCRFQPLTDVDWTVYKFKSKLLKLNDIFPEGIEIPSIYPGSDILHLPTVKTHGHSVTTGAVKNSFGGLLKEARHYAHKYIHEVLVDLLLMQKELHPNVFAVMDGTVAGDGAGPRTMVPKVKDVILASADSVAIDAVAAKLMGFDPMQIPYISMATDMGLGEGRVENIEIVGDDIAGVDFGFVTKRSFVIWGDQMLRIGPLRFLEKIALKSPLVVWAPFASNVYHDFFWYPTVGKKRIREFSKTPWGRLFSRYAGR
ncbi:MAG: DUF362 domain-containing protein [Candidatus Latescibacteria bacterium]|nr:DUF362 domain-containing protein [Candidatus Latescibacterota bacterium]NIM21126.1 DUF362 domain-containing protein [Candidatus Latescibacterota bacterium]NIM65261.1 DUF362 domain-containing protein [Candidatus Latescibacterota bacterium]NIO01776.1 DUF362 domain-containing protein [Candidatus Latescibacterota bacterium]NIO28293.1 DUF362 domain-containing protein [Candidatus Latescibacterota bacterium]